MTPTPNTRGKILDAFADQLAVAGYLGISLVEVARTAGIQKPSMYHHFPGGKEEVYAEVAFRFISRLAERITRALTIDGTLDDKLTALVATGTDGSSASASFEQRVYETLDHVSEQTKDRVSRAYVEDVLNPVSELFTRAVEAGDVHGEPEFLMNSFLHLARATDLMDSTDGASRLVELFMNGARAR